MKALLGLSLLLGVSAVCLAESQPVTLYAQVIRGTDQEKPAQAGWKPIGPKLSSRLCPKFRWNYYWEVSRKAVQVQPGKSVRIKATPEREMEIERGGSGESEIRLYTAGKLVRKSKQSRDSKITIMGGGSDESESWFIVGRRDKPTVD